MFFYRTLFASLCFISFGFAMGTGHWGWYMSALLCGSLSITAKKKKWEDPVWAVLMTEDFEAWIRKKKKEHRQKRKNK